MARKTEFEAFAVSMPGLEPVVADELRALGIDGRIESGGVAWTADAEGIYAANLWLRAASRVIVRVARFKARSFIELERHARRIDWSVFLADGMPIALRVSSRKSRLYHQRAIEERFARFIGERYGGSRIVGDVGTEGDDSDEGESAGAAQLLVIRFLRDECTVSVDGSGELLHRRGYRQAVAKAPLRETIGAAMLLASGWRGDTPLIDPFCGSGTIPIEAALLARGIAPGLAGTERRPRRFAFEDWPSFDPALWESVVAGALDRIQPRSEIRIVGTDRDSGAIEAAVANARRAGVSSEIEFAVKPLSALEPPSQPGWLVTNPPYGVRVGEARRLRDLYAAFGAVMRERLEGWHAVLLSADDGLIEASGLELEEVLSTRNGGIPVRLLRTRPPA